MYFYSEVEQSGQLVRPITSRSRGSNPVLAMDLNLSESRGEQNALNKNKSKIQTVTNRYFCEMHFASKIPSSLY